MPLPNLDTHPVPRDRASRFSGGPNGNYSLGDINQLPPVGSSSYYKSDLGKEGSAQRVRRVKLSEFFYGSPGCESTIVMMDDVIRQNDPEFKTFPHNMRNGTISEAESKWLHSKCLDKMSPDERDQFDDAIHICPKWAKANEVCFKYLQDDLVEPIAVVKAKMSTIKSLGKNCCADGSVLPILTPICVGAKVMLLENKVVEEDLANGSIGVVRDICYAPGEIMGKQGAKMYAIVEFTNSNLSECTVHGVTDTKMVAIPTSTKLCDKKCCTIETLPLRVCKGLTNHKVQGMSIGPGEQFEKGIIHFPDGKMKNIPGLVLTAFTRFKQPNDFAIGTVSSSLSKQEVMKIGTQKSYQEKRAFRAKLATKSEKTMRRSIERITTLDTASPKTYEGGCNFLLHCYRTNFSADITG